MHAVNVCKCLFINCCSPQLSSELISEVIVIPCLQLVRLLQLYDKAFCRLISYMCFKLGFVPHNAFLAMFASLVTCQACENDLFE